MRIRFIGSIIPIAGYLVSLLENIPESTTYRIVLLASLSLIFIVSVIPTLFWGCRMIKHLIKSFTDPKRMLYPHNLFVNFIVRSNYRQGRDPEWSCSLDLISTAFVHKTVNINIRVMEPEGLAGVEGTFEAIKLRPLMNNHVNDSIFVMPSRAREYIDGLEMGPVLMCVQITTEDTQGAFTSMYNLNTYFIKRNDKNVTS